MTNSWTEAGYSSDDVDAMPPLALAALAACGIGDDREYDDAAVDDAAAAAAATAAYWLVEEAALLLAAPKGELPRMGCITKLYRRIENVLAKRKYFETICLCIITHRVGRWPLATRRRIVSISSAALQPSRRWFPLLCIPIRFKRTCQYLREWKQGQYEVDMHETNT